MGRQVPVEVVELPGDAVMEAMDLVAQLERIDFAASPTGKLRLQSGKLGSELAPIREARKLAQLPLIGFGLEIGSHFDGRTSVARRHILPRMRAPRYVERCRRSSAEAYNGLPKLTTGCRS